MRKLTAAVLTACMVLPLAACSSGKDYSAAADEAESTIFTMGTVFSIRLLGDDADSMLKSTESVLYDENDLISWREDGSVISDFNSSHTADISQISDLIEMAQQVNEDSEGAFDITVLPLTKVWGFDKIGDADFDINSLTVPDQADIDSALAHVGMDKLQIDPDAGTMSAQDPDVQVELGAIGKGYAIQKAMAAADRVFDVMDMDEKIKDAPDAKELPAIEGRVIFDNVTFSYKEGQAALSNVSIQAEPGQMIALVGPSGSGKSTIANLIPRFYDIDSGSISIDGYDIREVTTNSLREQIGLVPQETMLFSTTVMENIRYGRLDATDEEIIAASKAANADEFIRELPEGYETKIGERGLNLSGGQRQRLAIARAILKNPRVLILDEATSALDTESEKIVQDALDKLMAGRTSFVIAHRLSTIFNANQIYVVENGHVVEHGTHEELLNQNGLYSNLYNIQFRNNNA